MTEKAPTTDSPENWGAASRGYAEKVAPFLMQAFADTFVERLDVNSDAEVLEVAAGSGALTEALAQRAKSVLATDYAPKMIEVLQERLRAGRDKRPVRGDGRSGALTRRQQLRRRRV